MGWGPGRKPREDHLAHRIRLRQHLVVPEAQHVVAGGVQERIATPVSARTGVLAAVDFNHETCLQAGEVDDVGTDRYLPPEPVARELAHPQASPEQALGVGHVGAQRAGPFSFLAVAHPSVSGDGSDAVSGQTAGYGIGVRRVWLSESSSLRPAPTPALHP